MVLHKDRQSKEGPCKIEKCTTKRYARGWCQTHYVRWQRYGDPLGRHSRWRRDVCSVGDCNRIIEAQRLCAKHYGRWRRTGRLDASLYGEGSIKNGYKMVSCTGHPNARRDGRIFEHRLAMSEVLGRPLLTGENVHHINGDRLDNRPENLELWITFQPSGQRVSDLLAWAQEVCRRYG